jgi:(1->4)-alpha-D-glucan 1-alpha-D-glucosylmutase
MPAPLPRATYRLQVSRDLPLGAVRRLLAYLDDLGISTLYLSPLLAARPGSPHGYDVIDPRRIDPERGTEAELRRLARAAHRRGMGILLDIVPNHMAADPRNPFWSDRLRSGPSARSARVFDVGWPGPPGRPARGVRRRCA